MIIIKEEIQKSLTKEWQATFRITRLTRMNFYDVLEALESLHNQGLVELRVRGKRQNIKQWRLVP